MEGVEALSAGYHPPDFLKAFDIQDALDDMLSSFGPIRNACDDVRDTCDMQWLTLTQQLPLARRTPPRVLIIDDGWQDTTHVLSPRSRAFLIFEPEEPLDLENERTRCLLMRARHGVGTRLKRMSRRIALRGVFYPHADVLSRALRTGSCRMRARGARSSVRSPRSPCGRHSR